MPGTGSIDVSYRIAGLSLLLSTERTIGAKTEGILTDHLIGVGRYVAQDVRDRYQGYSAKGADGVQEKVFVSGLYVVQTLRKSSNMLRRRSNFGPMIYKKAFLPAARENQDRVALASQLAVEEAKSLYWDRA